MSTINMQTMRYINLLDRTSRVKTTNCFIYNNSIVFAVPQSLVSQAIGRNAENVRYIQDQIGKKIRIITESKGVEDAQRFISDIIAPIKFKSLEKNDKEIIINAGSIQNKANLFGRNKKRFEELSLIIHDVFNLELKII